MNARPPTTGEQEDAIGLIQARMSSSRLPGKVLRAHRGSTVLERVVRLTQSFTCQAVVCTSTDVSDDPIEAHCRELDVTCVRGPLDDVFQRFALALASPGVRHTPWFFRITADCPLLSAELGRALLAARTSELDYLWFDDALLPRGISSELVRRAAFESIDASAIDAAEREHVTVGLRERSCFRSAKVPVPAALLYPALRLTLDYPQDEALLQALWAVDDQLSAEQAVAYLLSHPELAAINSSCQQKPVRQELASHA